MRGEARHLVRRFGFDLRAELGIPDRVVHVREHEVLPNQEAQLVAERVEVVALVGHRAADAHHVRAGIAQLGEGAAQLLVRCAKATN